MSIRRFMTLEKAAQALEADEREILALVAEDRLRCGVFSKWYGQAMPAGGGRWEGSVSKYHGPNISRDATFRYLNQETKEQFYVRLSLSSQFWFLEHHDAYLIATSPDGAVEVGFLVPEDGAKLHEQDPERFPMPEFVLWLETGEGAQDEPRRITRSDLLFRRIDIEELKQKAADNDRDTTTSNEDRSFMSNDLLLMNRASRKWWANADKIDRTTHPQNDEVAFWLEKNGMKKSVAKSAASIIRPEWAPSGRPPKE